MRVRPKNIKRNGGPERSAHSKGSSAHINDFDEYWMKKWKFYLFERVALLLLGNEIAELNIGPRDAVRPLQPEKKQLPRLEIYFSMDFYGRRPTCWHRGSVCVEDMSNKHQLYDEFLVNKVNYFCVEFMIHAIPSHGVRRKKSFLRFECSSGRWYQKEKFSFLDRNVDPIEEREKRIPFKIISLFSNERTTIASVQYSTIRSGSTLSRNFGWPSGTHRTNLSYIIERCKIINRNGFHFIASQYLSAALMFARVTGHRFERRGDNLNDRRLQWTLTFLTNKLLRLRRTKKKVQNKFIDVILSRRVHVATRQRKFRVRNA